jgi:hypothetical protein
VGEMAEEVSGEGAAGGRQRSCVWVLYYLEFIDGYCWICRLCNLYWWLCENAIGCLSTFGDIVLSSICLFNHIWKGCIIEFWGIFWISYYGFWGTS